MSESLANRDGERGQRGRRWRVIAEL